jgi:hypothetical protein
MVYEFTTTHEYTSDLTEVDGIGNTGALRFSDEFGMKALNKISKLARDDPYRLTRIDNIGSSTAENLRERMIDANIYVPQPGDVFDQQTTDATIWEVQAQGEAVFPETIAEAVKAQLQDEPLDEIARAANAAVVPEHSSRILIEAAERAIGTMNIPIMASGTATEPFTDGEFRDVTRTSLHELWGTESGGKITQWVEDLLMPKKEEDLSPTQDGVREAVRTISISYLYQLETEIGTPNENNPETAQS